MTRIHRLFGTVGAVSVSMLGVLAWRPAESAPLPKDVRGVEVKLAGEMTIANVEIQATAFVGETKLVFVGEKYDEKAESIPSNPGANGLLLDLTKKAQTPFTNSHTAPIMGLSVSGQKIFTVSNSNDATLRAWDCKANKALPVVEIDESKEVTMPYYGVAHFHKTTCVAVGAGNRVLVFNPEKPDERTQYELPEGSVGVVGTRLQVSPDDSWIASAGLDRVVLWNLKTKEVTELSIVPEKSAPEEEWFAFGVVFDPNGTLYAWRGEAKKDRKDEVPLGKAEADTPVNRRGVVRIDLDKKKVIPLPIGHTICTHTVAIDPTGKWLVTGGSSHPDKPKPKKDKGMKEESSELRIYHLPTQTLVHREQFDEWMMGWVGFSPSGKRLATYDGVVRWWDVTAK